MKICREYLLSLRIFCTKFLIRQFLAYKLKVNVKHSQWRHSITNINIYKCQHYVYFAASSHRFLHNDVSHREHLGRGRGEQHSKSNIGNAWLVIFKCELPVYLNLDTHIQLQTQRRTWSTTKAEACTALHNYLKITPATILRRILRILVIAKISWIRYLENYCKHYLI